MKKIVSLTVHKNTLEKRKGREKRQEMVRTAKTLCPNMKGYAMFAWDKDGSVYATYDTGMVVSPCVLPHMINAAITGLLNPDKE